MLDLEIESWALRIVDAIGRGMRPEDSRVECKRLWPEPSKVARQLAGSANAGRGQPILWLIGVDEKTGPVEHASVELATWRDQLAACFDADPPFMERDLVVTADSGSFTALLFETSRAPYVVKAEGVRLEVPWREATGTRSATRADLVSLLGDRAGALDFEFIEGHLFIAGRETWRWDLSLSLYARVPLGSEIVVPDRSVTAFGFGIQDAQVEFTAWLNPAKHRRSMMGNVAERIETVLQGVQQLVFTGPGPVTLVGHAETQEVESHVFGDDPIRIDCAMLPVFATTPTVLHFVGHRAELASGERLRWRLSQA